MTTKEKILEAALKLFNEKNTQAATTNHIAAFIGISPGNLHYHYANREDIIRNLYKTMQEEFFVLFKTYPSSITDLAKLHENKFKIEWEYRFFYRELLFLLSKDKELKSLYKKDILKEKEQIKQIILSLKNNGILKIPYDNIIDYLCDIILLIDKFWSSYMQLIDQFSINEGIKRGIQRIEETLRPFLSKEALKELAKFEG